MSEISNSCYLLYGVKKFPSDYSLDTSLEYIKYNELAQNAILYVSVNRVPNTGYTGEFGILQCSIKYGVA